MKEALRKLFSPILKPLESGEAGYEYRQSHRKILLVMGVLFIFLATFALIATIYSAQWGGLLPVIVFMLAGILCEVVALLGNDQAVARLWKSK